MGDTEICRTCLVGNKNMFGIFKSGGPTEINLADMLMSFVSVKITQQENLPDTMCSDCIKTLTLSYNFKKQCERSDFLLRSNKTVNKTNVPNKQESIEIVMTDDFPDDNEVDSDEEDTKDIFDEYDKRKFRCNLCGRGFMKSGNLTIHMKTHTENNECSYCNIQFKTHQELLLHIKKNHKYFKCTVCDKSYATGNALNAHMRMHKISNSSKPEAEENAEYICVIGIGDPTTNTKEKDSKFEGEVEMSEKNEYANCSQCSLPCISDEALKLHEKIHEEHHECDTCQLIFMAYTDFVDHNKTVHSIYNCSKCVKSFPTVYGLSGHSNTHIIAEDNPCIMYKCSAPMCNKKYRTVEYLKLHMLQHTKANKVYLCKICGKTYNTSNSFYYHKKIHTDQRPYVCKYCGNAYKIYSHLKTHLWRHSSILPHRCNKCGKGFTRRQILRKHIESNCGSKKRRKHLINGNNDTNNTLNNISALMEEDTSANNLYK